MVGRRQTRKPNFNSGACALTSPWSGGQRPAEPVRHFFDCIPQSLPRFGSRASPKICVRHRTVQIVPFKSKRSTPTRSCPRVAPLHPAHARAGTQEKCIPHAAAAERRFTSLHFINGKSANSNSAAIRPRAIMFRSAALFAVIGKFALAPFCAIHPLSKDTCTTPHAIEDVADPQLQFEQKVLFSDCIPHVGITPYCFSCTSSLQIAQAPHTHSLELLSTPTSPVRSPHFKCPPSPASRPERSSTLVATQPLR